MTPRELPPTSEPDYSFLIRTAPQLSHISFPLLCRVRQEFSPRFNIYPALLYLYREFLPRIEWGALGEGGWYDINHENLLPICRCKPISRLAFKGLQLISRRRCNGIPMMFKYLSHPFSNTAAVTVALLAAVRQQVGASLLTPHIFTHVRVFAATDSQRRKRPQDIM